MPNSRLPRLRRSTAEFLAARDGNVAVLFGIASIPIIIAVGVAVDYSRAAAARTAMQSATDSAALMASKDYGSGAIRESEIPAKVDSYFRALYSVSDVSNIAVKATFTKKSSDGTSTVRVETSGQMPVNFLKFAGVDNIPFNASATSTWGATRLRVAIALDITGSMNEHGKLKAMKDAAVQLVKTLKASATTADDVYIAIIPFNQMVNVGTDKINATWLDWHGKLNNNLYDSRYDYGSCSSSNLKYRTAELCKAANRTWTFFGECSDDEYETASECQSHGKTWTEKRSTDWKGCVTDRDLLHTYDNDTTKITPTIAEPATLFVAKFYRDCGPSMLPMKSAFEANEADNSTDPTTIKGRINSLTAVGATNQSIGMHWAWMALQLQSPPFNSPAKEGGYKYTDAIILLSDGVNTKNYWSGNGSDYSSEVDDRQRMLCQNIKNAANGTTTVFTIQVNTTNDPNSAVLEYCANDGQFYQSKSAEQIKLAFQAIGSSLTKLRLAQ
jgi:Flp pilus assembly protein TadG